MENDNSIKVQLQLKGYDIVNYENIVSVDTVDGFLRLTFSNGFKEYFNVNEVIWFNSEIV